MNLNTWIRERISGNKIPLELPPHMQGLHGLSLQEAIDAHEAWIAKLELTLRNQNPDEYDPAVVGNDTICTVGRWIYGYGVELNNYPEYHDVLTAHRDFHLCASTIIQSHKSGQFGNATKALRYDLVELSNAFQVNFVRLLVASQG